MTEPAKDFWARADRDLLERWPKDATGAPETAAKIDAMAAQIIKEAHEKALGILKAHEGKLHELAEYLLEKETITGEAFMSILNA